MLVSCERETWRQGLGEWRGRRLLSFIVYSSEYESSECIKEESI